MSNAYTYDVPTSIINYLYNLLIMYENPIAATLQDNKTYAIMDIFQFNPASKDPRYRWLLFIIDTKANINFYTVNMGLNSTLTSLEPVTNIYTVPILQLRIQYFFVSDSTRYGLKYHVTNINKLNEQKIALANINNLPGSNFILWGNFFISFIIYKDGTLDANGALNMRLCLSQTAFLDPKTQKWDSSIILYDINNGTLVATIKGKPVFAINSKEFFYFNYQYYIPNNPANRQLVGGKSHFLYEKTDVQIAIICKTQELQFQAPFSNANLLLFVPVDQFYRIGCSFLQGYLYLYGFEGINNLDNFYTIVQVASFEQQFETMVFAGFKTQYTQEKLPQQPIFDYDGLIVWAVFIEGGIQFVIYEPTFKGFLKLHSTLLQGINDLIFN